MDPDTLKQVAAGAIPPGVFAALALTLVWWRRPVEKDGPGWRWVWGAVILAIAYIPTHLLVLRGPAWPPASAADWLPPIALLAAGAGLPAGAPRLPPLVRWPGVGLITIAMGWMSAAGLIARSWSVREMAAHLAGFAAVSVVAALGAARVTARRPGPGPVLIVMLPVAAASQLLVLVYHSLLLGQAAGIAAAVLGGALVAGLWKRWMVLGPAGSVPPVLLAMACLFHGVLYTETDRGLLLAGLVAASPAAAGLASMFTSRAAKGWVRFGAPLAAAALPLAAAMAVAVLMRETPGGY